MPMDDDSQTGHVDCFYQDKMIQFRKVYVSKNLSRLGLHVCELVRNTLRRRCVANGQWMGALLFLWCPIPFNVPFSPFITS